MVTRILRGEMNAIDATLHVPKALAAAEAAVCCLVILLSTAATAA